MIKQVIIDKGNGFQQRLSYDNSTNQIIPEDIVGPRETDNVLAVIGQQAVDSMNLSISAGEDCVFCKGKKNTSGIPFATQCSILNGIEVSYSPCSGPIHKTSLYNIVYKGISRTDAALHFSFYDSTGNLCKTYVLQTISGAKFSFYLHQNSTNKVEIRVLDYKIGQTVGECILKIGAYGAIPLNLYKDISNMKIYFDNNTKNIKYINLNKAQNLNYIDVITTQGSSIKITRLISGKTYKIPGNINLGHGSTADFPWLSTNNESLLGFTKGIYTDATNTITILGYEEDRFGTWRNVFIMDPDIVPNGTDDNDNSGGV